MLLERVQHRFTRMIPGFRQLSYETRLDRLKLCTLEERPNRADLLEVFNMYKGMSLLPFHQFFRNSTVVTTRGHSAKIAKVGCHLDLRHYFFSNRVIDRWNQLPQTVIESCSVLIQTRSSAIAEGPRDASCQLKSCQLPRNSAETTYTTSPGQIDGMKLEI